MKGTDDEVDSASSLHTSVGKKMAFVIKLNNKYRNNMLMETGDLA